MLKINYVYYNSIYDDNESFVTSYHCAQFECRTGIDRVPIVFQMEIPYRYII